MVLGLQIEFNFPFYLFFCSVKKAIKECAKRKPRHTNIPKQTNGQTKLQNAQNVLKYLMNLVYTGGFQDCSTELRFSSADYEADCETFADYKEAFNNLKAMSKKIGNSTKHSMTVSLDIAYVQGSIAEKLMDNSNYNGIIENCDDPNGFSYTYLVKLRRFYRLVLKYPKLKLVALSRNVVLNELGKYYTSFALLHKMEPMIQNFWNSAN